MALLSNSADASTWRYSDLPLGRELDPTRTFPGFRLKVALEWTADVEPEAPEAEDTTDSCKIQFRTLLDPDADNTRARADR